MFVKLLLIAILLTRQNWHDCDIIFVVTILHVIEIFLKLGFVFSNKFFGQRVQSMQAASICKYCGKHETFLT